MRFAVLGVIAAALPPTPAVPDWFPIAPIAFTNPIYLDTDGNGAYDAPLGPPDWNEKAQEAFARAGLEPTSFAG